MNDCVGIDEAVDVVLCWRAFVAGTIAGVCGMDCPFCVWLALHLAAGGSTHQLSLVAHQLSPQDLPKPLIPPEVSWSHRLRLST